MLVYFVSGPFIHEMVVLNSYIQYLTYLVYSFTTGSEDTVSL
jgi:hypothetical protein